MSSYHGMKRSYHGVKWSYQGMIRLFHGAEQNFITILTLISRFVFVCII